LGFARLTSYPSVPMILWIDVYSTLRPVPICHILRVRQIDRTWSTLFITP